MAGGSVYGTAPRTVVVVVNSFFWYIVYFWMLQHQFIVESAHRRMCLNKIRTPFAQA